MVAKSGASQLVEEVKCFRALVQVTYTYAKRNAMVGGCQGVRKVLGFRVSSREFLGQRVPIVHTPKGFGQPVL